MQDLANEIIDILTNKQIDNESKFIMIYKKMYDYSQVNDFEYDFMISHTPAKSFKTLSRQIEYYFNSECYLKIEKVINDLRTYQVTLYLTKKEYYAINKQRGKHSFDRYIKNKLKL